MSAFCYHPGPSHRCTIDDRELHCGDCFQIRNGERKIDVRIELGQDWVLIGATPNRAEYWDGNEANFYPR